MSASSVVLTSGTAPDVLHAFPDAIHLPDIDDDDTWVARTALAITANLATSQSMHGTSEQLLLVVSGPLTRHAPELGFAQRAARRSVRGYVLIDAQLPRVGQVSDWPDAPVTVILTDENDTRARDARLRGWEVLIGDPVVILTELIARP